MKNSTRYIILGGLVIIVGAILLFKGPSDKGDEAVTTHRDSSKEALPLLIELGSVGCIPCQKMAPVLDEISVEYEGRLSVEFYDVKQNPEPARRYGIRLIPTQIFLDAQGKEFFRHEGFFPKDEIKRVLSEMGVE